MSGKHINGDRRSYVAEKNSVDITEGGFKLVFCHAKKAWITPGGGVIKIRSQAEIYARKVGNFVAGLSV